MQSQWFSIIYFSVNIWSAKRRSPLNSALVCYLWGRWQTSSCQDALDSLASFPSSHYSWTDCDKPHQCPAPIGGDISKPIMFNNAGGGDGCCKFFIHGLHFPQWSMCPISEHTYMALLALGNRTKGWRRRTGEITCSEYRSSWRVQNCELKAWTEAPFQCYTGCMWATNMPYFHTTGVTRKSHSPMRDSSPQQNCEKMNHSIGISHCVSELLNLLGQCNKDLCYSSSDFTRV